MSRTTVCLQVDLNKNLSKPVTQHYLPKKTESTFAKPDHMIASSSSRNSSKNMPRFSLNDMVHNHYLDVAKKKIQERDRNSTTTDDRKPNPRRKLFDYHKREQSLDLSGRKMASIFTSGSDPVHNVSMTSVQNKFSPNPMSNDVDHNGIKPHTSSQMTSVSQQFGLKP
ncbi:hypothetical protein Tco_0383103 [Tanacetum coccineum]